MLHIPSVLSTGSGLADSSSSHSPNSKTPNSKRTPQSTTSANGGAAFPHQPGIVTASPPPGPVFNTYNSDDDEDYSDNSNNKRKRKYPLPPKSFNSSTESFDMLDQISESIHAICIGMNRDASRIFAGHDCGFTVWNIDVPLPSSVTSSNQNQQSGALTSSAQESTALASTNANTTSTSNNNNKKTPHRTITLARMFGKTWVDVGGKGFVFCASVLNRTDYAVCGAKTKIKDVESEEIFVLQGQEVRYKLMSRVAADGGNFLRDVHIEQDRIFALCSNSFHLFDLSGKPLLMIPSAAEIPLHSSNLFSAQNITKLITKNTEAVSKTVGKAASMISGYFWGSSSSSKQEDSTATTSSQQHNNEIPPSSPALGDTARSGSANPGNSTCSSDRTVFSSDSDRPTHVQQHTSVLSVLSGADEDTMSVCAFPGRDHAGSFTIVDWKKLQVLTKNQKDVVAHQGHLACVNISMGSGNVKLLAVTASTSGTTCRVWNALTGEKLRNLRMCNPLADGAAPSSFKLRGLEIDCFGRVAVLCQDSRSKSSSAATASVASLSAAGGSASSTQVTASSFNTNSSPQTPLTQQQHENTLGKSHTSNTTVDAFSAQQDQLQQGGHNALEALFFDADVPGDSLAPVAGEHYNLENTSFASRTVTAGIGMVAGQRLAEAKDALRPMSRIVLPLRPSSSSSNGVAGNSNNNATGGGLFSNAVPSLPKNNSNDNDQDNNSNSNNQTSANFNSSSPNNNNGQFNIEELISLITLVGDYKKQKHVVNPDSMPIVVSRIHSSGIKSIAQVTFGALPRDNTIETISRMRAAVQSIESNNNYNTNNDDRTNSPQQNSENNNNNNSSSPPSGRNGNLGDTSRSNNNNDALLPPSTSTASGGRMGAEIRDVKMLAGTARFDVIKQF